MFDILPKPHVTPVLERIRAIESICHQKVKGGKVHVLDTLLIALSLSAEAEERFNTVLARKTLVLERGLRLNANLDGAMAEMIAERNWFKFVEQPRPAVVSIVKEFYANTIDRIDSVVQVRGKPMAFDNGTINAYYGLETPD